MLPVIHVESWEDWTRIYNDVSVWQGLIDAICSREGISYRQLHPASANTNAVFLLDRAFAVKIYSPFWDEFAFERELLTALGSEQGIPTAELAGSGQISDGDGVAWPYLITRYRAERPFSEIRAQLPTEEAVSLVRQFGGIVRRLHRLDAGRFAGVAAEQIWTELVTERRRRVLDELTQAGMLSVSVGAPLEALLDRAIDADLVEARLVVHGDLGGDHVLCAPAEDGWRIDALIDFGDAKVGVREYEWMPLWFGCFERDPVLARAFVEAYDPGLLSDPEFPMRAAAWTLLHDFGADELTRQWRELGRAEPIETIEELLEFLGLDPTLV